MSRLKTTHLLIGLMIILSFYLIFLATIQDSNGHLKARNTPLKIAAKISDLVAPHLYNLDAKNLRMTVESIIAHNESINALDIKDVVSGKSALTYFKSENSAYFNRSIDENVRLYSDYANTDIVYDGLVIGTVHLYISDDEPLTDDRFHIGYYAAVFVLVILLLSGIFHAALKRSDAKLSSFDINSNKFLYSFLLSIIFFVMIATAVSYLLIDSSRSYAIERTRSDLNSVVRGYQEGVENKVNLMKSTFDFITSTDEFINVFDELMITRNEQVNVSIKNNQNRLIQVFKRYENLHIGGNNAFAVLNTKGSVLTHYGDSVVYDEFNVDIYPYFLEALRGRASIFSIGAYYDHIEQDYKGNLFFSTPIVKQKSGEIVGVIVSEILTDELFFPDDYKKYFQNTGEMLAVDTSGIVISRCKKGNCLGNKKYGIIPISQPPSNGDISDMERTTDYQGTKVFAVASKQSTFQANFIAKIDVDEALTEHNDFQWALIIITSGMSAFVILSLGFTLIIVRKVTGKQIALNRSLIERLGNAAEFKDNDTGMHVVRMSHYARIVAVNYGCTKQWCENLFTAAPMHDIGKIGIPDKILHKPGKLTTQEWDVMKAHPIFGAKIIGEHSSPLLIMAKDISIAHHEKWDGSGYPYNLMGEQIPLSARIIAIADVFDALTTVRPYKEAWSDEKAIALIKSESGSHFDPEVVDAFIRSIDEILQTKDQYRDIQCDPTTQNHLKQM